MNGPKTHPGNLMVLYEDNHLIAVSKRAGDIVQGDKTGDTPLPETVKDYIAHKYQKPGKVFLGVVHRLDRPTTGVIVFARTSKALSRMNRLFAEGGTRKTYWALVGTPPPETAGRLVHWLERNPKQNKSYARAKEVPGSKQAILNYRLLGSLDRYHLLEIDLETGRHHQIRAQLAAIGSPIKGDLKYGFPRSNPDGGIHLHARRLEFIHPVRQDPVSILAPLPDDPLWEACGKLDSI
ncbi:MULTISPECIES: RluA family pseudouridine synthase [unclassified Robiginitalea]|uniref:RluA family pseudouridine synthase n=1 Tax=Robiginitalea TaxID=252306 RepID=UPI00234A2188|nr:MULTISPECIES: RluA family pseudouridine synthase [unclassified Robiginitalea]MDC6354228.1 RluA family pseudouridine synthase [Robiginitalea sp. PM2]MDC6374495.1 RluA family pseudouridine synthase [Robiginitalea sp. SP8]